MKSVRVFGCGLGVASLALAIALVPAEARASDRARSDASTIDSIESNDGAKDSGAVLARRRRAPKKKAATADADVAEKRSEAIVGNATRQGPTRIEFDERLLQGQTNKANAIYLFQRRASALRSLVKKRKHFHDEIDEALE